MSLETAAAPATRRRALVVLGMHRSGTSPLTRVISLLGADLPSQLMSPIPGINETGFWESTGVAALNDEVLASAGSVWDDLSAFPASWLDSDPAQAYRDRAVAILERDFGDSSLLVLKDPRICRLVPFWISVLERFGAEPAFVIACRHPQEVAISLKMRDGFLLNKSCLLWLRHLLEAERGTRSHQRTFVSYRELLRDWRQVAAKISNDLSVTWPRQSPQIAVEIESFLRPDLRHHRFDGKDVDSPAIPDAVRCAYRALEGALEGATDPLPQAFDEIHEQLEAADGLFAPVLAEERLHLTEARNEISRLSAAAEEVSGLQAELNESREMAECLRQENEARARELEQLRNELTASAVETEGLTKEISERRAQIAAKAAELDRLGKERAEQATTLESLRRKLAARDFEITRRDRELEALDSRLTTLGALLGDARNQSCEMLRRVLAAADRGDCEGTGDR